MNDEGAIRCPFYLSKKRKNLRQAITITCENIENNLGFDVKNMLSFQTVRDREDWMGIFCNDRFGSCPYYQKIYEKYEEEDDGNCKGAEKKN